ncbi:MAG: insulinase family protein, partial [Verrucomicrobiota bacterium]
FQIRLREKLREELGGTYSVASYATSNPYPTPQFRMRVAFSCAPDRVESMIEAVNREIDYITNNRLEDIYLTKVTEGQLKRRELELKTNGFWSQILKFAEWYGEDPLDVLKYEETVKSLTLEDIQETAKKYFATPNVATFILKPEAEAAGDDAPSS